MSPIFSFLCTIRFKITMVFLSWSTDCSPESTMGIRASLYSYWKDHTEFYSKYDVFHRSLRLYWHISVMRKPDNQVKTTSDRTVIFIDNFAAFQSKAKKKKESVAWILIICYSGYFSAAPIFSCLHSLKSMHEGCSCKLLYQPGQNS